jgi:hypothetical protein
MEIGQVGLCLNTTAGSALRDWSSSVSFVIGVMPSK